MAGAIEPSLKTLTYLNWMPETIDALPELFSPPLISTHVSLFHIPTPFGMLYN